MPLYRYTGYRQDGTAVDGTIEAEGYKDALSGVKARGVYPRDVMEYAEEGGRWFSKRPDPALLSRISRQLSTLLNSGVPVVDALRSIADEQHGRWKGVMVRLRDHVAGGASLSRALEQQSEIFPEFYIAMVAAGEASGSVGRVLDRIASYLDRQETVKANVRTAMIYPIFMSAVGFTVLSFLFIFVVPKIVRIFEYTKSALPLVTVVLIMISNLFVHYWWLLGLITIAIVYAIGHANRRHRTFIDRMKLSLPGGVLRTLYFGRFARTLSFLLDGGLPALKALELAGKSAGNRVVEGWIVEAARRVSEGARLSSSIEGMPPVLRQLIATGEKSGSLVPLLASAADAYEAEFDRQVRRALSLVGPLMILVMGLIVGFIVLAVLLPLFQLNQLVG